VLDGRDRKGVGFAFVLECWCCWIGGGRREFEDVHEI